ncbi:MAG TPA: hypothetical protein VHH36_05990, partial [Candidatus Thermoplasmatota archaeon]|nr:hypothetical protein [Candidatus Thermoplasmatota archaeon]
AAGNLTQWANGTLQDPTNVTVPRLPNPILAPNPQVAAAQTLALLDGKLPGLPDLVGLWDQPWLWNELGRFNRTVEGMDVRLLRLPDVPLQLDNVTLENLTEQVERFEADLLRRAQEMEASLRKLQVASPLPGNYTDWINETLNNTLKLNPLFLAVKLRAFDAVGNEGIAVEPVLTDVLSPTPLLYLLGDTLRERLLPMVLGASAHVNLTDLHGTISLFDPDCGLEDVQFNMSPVGSPLLPLVTLYPRDGRVDFDLRKVRDLAPDHWCGFYDYALDAHDKFGRTTRVQGRLLLDRLGPDTGVDSIDAQLLPTRLPYVNDLQPPVAVNGSAWIGVPALKLEVGVDSRNLPGCKPAAVHEVVVESRVAHGEWIKLATKHYGSLQAATEDFENATVIYEPSIRVEAASFGLDDVNLSGHPLEFRVHASDEGGNVESNLTVDFVRAFDVVPPLCDVQLHGQMGADATLSYNLSDDAQGQAGAVANAYLVYRPASPAPGIWAGGRWAVFGEIPVDDPNGTATIPFDGLPAGGDALSNAATAVRVACAVYDEAGNGRIVGNATSVLNLARPEVAILPDPWPRWSNGDEPFTWLILNATSQTIRAHRADDPSVGRLVGTQ